MQQDTPRLRISEVRERLRKLERLTGQSSRRFDQVIERFELFADRGFGVTELEAVVPKMVELFVKARSKDGEPSIATMHMRRSVLRLLFRVAHDEFGFDDDPTRFVDLAARSILTTRPLIDDEVVLGRSYSLHTLTSTRQPAAWALGEATATTAEIAYITIDDLQLDHTDGPRVWLHGSRKRNERWGLLSEWGSTQLERRASALRSTKHLVYTGEGTEESRQASCCIAIKETLIRAGLESEPDVRPASVAAWAGRAVLDETGRIEIAAQRLGIRSLDAAARFVAFEWQA